eukprot:224490-Heterocapsa_arctica.AAC.1
MVARLSSRTGKGKTTAHGHVFSYDSVEACSHRRLRQLFSADGGDVHLCAVSPCSTPGITSLHCCNCYAAVAATAVVDVSDLS